MTRTLLTAAVAFALLAGVADAQSRRGPPPHAREGQPAWNVEIPEPGAPTVFFLNLKDGATVSSPLTIEFGALGMVVLPAGTDAESGRAGHHHLLIDVTADQLDLTQPIPADEHHLHFGDGQRSVTLALLPGTYTLQLLAGDANHVPHDPPLMSRPITITVSE